MRKGVKEKNKKTATESKESAEGRHLEQRRRLAGCIGTSKECPLGRGWAMGSVAWGGPRVTDATEAGTLFREPPPGRRGRRHPRRSDPRLTRDLARRPTSNCDKTHMADNYSE